MVRDLEGIAAIGDREAQPARSGQAAEREDSLRQVKMGERGFQLVEGVKLGH